MTQLIGQYALLEKIGSSVLGSVYRAQDTASGSLVAVKVLQLGMLDDVSSSEMDARLQRDYEAAARLQHPGIARILEIRRDGDTALIVSELVEGPPITSLARGPAGSDLGQVVAAVAQLLETLEFAHGQGAIHRDLKPSNVLIQGTRIKITDFGMADLGARNRDDTGALVGETAYMAPEQFLSGVIDKRCDIHAVGTILYELLTGKSPFRGDPNTVAAMFKVLDLVPPPPSELRPGLTPGFDRVVSRALAKSPAQRFMTAYLFRAELIAAYVALVRRPPPDMLEPLALTPPQTAGSESRTTLIQSDPSPQSPQAVRPELHDVAAETPRRMPSEKPPSTPPSPAPPSFDSTPARRATALPADPSKTAPLDDVSPASLGSAPAAWVSPEPAAPPNRPLADAARAAPAPVSEAMTQRPAFVPRQSVTPTASAAAPVSPQFQQGEPRAALTEAGHGHPLRPQEFVRHAVAVAEAPEAAAPVEQAENGRLPPQRDDGAPVGSAAMPAASPAAPAHGQRWSSVPAEIAPGPAASFPAASLETRPTAASAFAPRPARATFLPPKPVVPLTDASIAHCGRELAQFVGPIAIVFSRLAARDAHDERGFIELLAAHLTDPNERAQFLRKVRQRPA